MMLAAGGRIARIGLFVAVVTTVATACVEGGAAGTTTTVGRTTLGTSQTTTTTSQTTTTTPQTTTTAANPAGPACGGGITVGVITDRTGPLAIRGAQFVRGLSIGFEYATGAPPDGDVYEVGGCPVRVVYRDDRGDARSSATLARELIHDEGADVLIGTVSPGGTSMLQQVSREEDVILIAAPSSADEVTGSEFDPRTFRAGAGDVQAGIAVCEHLIRRSDRFVQIASEDSFGHEGARVYRDACAELGGTFAADDLFVPVGTTDFTPYLEQFVGVDAGALLVTWDGGGFGLLVRAAADLGLLDVMALGAPFVDNVAMPRLFADAIGTTSTIGYHYTAPDNPVNDYLVGKVAEHFGTFPDLFDADGMNAAIMVVEAIRATGGDTSAGALGAALEGMTFEGPKGTISIRAEDHVAIQDVYVATLLTVTDPEFRYYAYVATLRPEPPCLLEGDEVARCGGLPAGG